MKKIVIKNYEKALDGYLVKLGNGYEYLFNSEKNAQSFLRKTSQFLTEQLSFINHIYTNVFVCYRNNFLLFVPNSGKRSADIYQAERNLIEFLQRIPESLNKSFWMAQSENGNFIVFAAFYYCVTALRNSCFELNRLADRQKLTTLKYELINLQSEINLIERNLNEYELNKAARTGQHSRFMDIVNISMSKVV
ncbi:hypothetical protein [Carboxylicivirga caseinilyticus]|uniref:hypothetical protein n=1 Tax=Carboxylicivirga caseinilyticus TaxID=3417572 RepID=UPI003D339771|nr:hypothetical protein [Marinilabiliaceae bacterium A049]